jgi:4-hydroxy-tetrahydrodipicolinate synthase
MQVDEEGQRRVVDFCIENGADGIACLLLAGEFYKFSDAERKRVASIVVSEAKGRVPVLVGISHTGTVPAIELGLDAKKSGADGVIVTPPYHANFVGEAEASLTRHYEQVASGVALPIMIQDYATEGGVQLGPSELESIVRRSENIKYVKIEGLRHLDRIKAMNRRLKGRVGIFGGMAGRYLLDELRLGTIGTLPGAETVDVLKKIFDAYSDGRQHEARKAMAALSPYLEFLVQNFDSFVSIEKEVLRTRGVIQHATVRQPSIPLGRPKSAQLSKLLRSMVLAPLSSHQGDQVRPSSEV